MPSDTSETSPLRRFSAPVLVAAAGLLLATANTGADQFEKYRPNVDGGKRFRAETFGTGIFRFRPDGMVGAAYGPGNKNFMTGNWQRLYDPSGALAGYKVRAAYADVANPTGVKCDYLRFSTYYYGAIEFTLPPDLDLSNVSAKKQPCSPIIQPQNPRAKPIEEVRFFVDHPADNEWVSAETIPPMFQPDFENPVDDLAFIGVPVAQPLLEMDGIKFYQTHEDINTLPLVAVHDKPDTAPLIDIDVLSLQFEQPACWAETRLINVKYRYSADTMTLYTKKVMPELVRRFPKKDPKSIQVRHYTRGDNLINAKHVRRKVIAPVITTWMRQDDDGQWHAWDYNDGWVASKEFEEGERLTTANAMAERRRLDRERGTFLLQYIQSLEGAELEAYKQRVEGKRRKFYESQGLIYVGCGTFEGFNNEILMRDIFYRDNRMGYLERHPLFREHYLRYHINFYSACRAEVPENSPVYSEKRVWSDGFEALLGQAKIRRRYFNRFKYYLDNRTWGAVLAGVADLTGLPGDITFKGVFRSYDRASTFANALRDDARRIFSVFPCGSRELRQFESNLQAIATGQAGEIPQMFDENQNFHLETISRFFPLALVE